MCVLEGTGVGWGAVLNRTVERGSLILTFEEVTKEDEK